MDRTKRVVVARFVVAVEVDAAEYAKLSAEERAALRETAEATLDQEVDSLVSSGTTETDLAEVAGLPTETVVLSWDSEHVDPDAQLADLEAH